MYQVSIHPWLIFGFGLVLGACAGLICAAPIWDNRWPEQPEDETARWNRLKQEYEDAP